MIKNLLTNFFQRIRKREYIEDILYGEKELSFKDKKAIASLIGTDEFRVFEKYLQIKQRGRAKRLLHCPEGDMGYIRREIGIIAEITADMSRFWVEIQNPEVSASVKEGNTFTNK